MRFFVNNDELQTGEKDMVMALHKYLSDKQLIITEIRANDILVDLDLQDILKMEGLEKLEVLAATAAEILGDSINDAVDYIPRLIEVLQAVANMFQEGEEGKAIKLFLETLDGIGWINELVILLETNKGALPGEMAQTLSVAHSADYKDKLGQLLAAWENRDYVLLADLLNYELIPSLENILNWMSTSKQMTQ